MWESTARTRSTGATSRAKGHQCQRFNRSAGEVSNDIKPRWTASACRRAGATSSAASTKNMAELFAYAASRIGAGHHLHLHDSGQPVPAELPAPLALMTSLPLTLIGVVLALLMFRLHAPPCPCFRSSAW